MNAILFKKLVNVFTLLSFFMWNLAVAAPVGGSVAQGSASISQTPGGSLTTINQASQNTVINWSSFNTNQGETVRFNQPNASAIALNRINSGLPTSFAGILSANGQVWIVNPNGVLFTGSSQVNVAGLLATTHSITDANFMAGNYQFTLDNPNSTATVVNNGTITVADTGMVALVAPGVENNGIIKANLGKVTLATGSSYVVDLYGDQLINFGNSAPVQNGFVSNAGKIIAHGGTVYLTANSAAKVVDNVINVSGVIIATTARNGKNGTIILNGGSAGHVRISGTLNASNTVNNSGGGYIETSGYEVDIEQGANINAGMGGTWLMDPWNIYVNSWLAACIENALNDGSNVHEWAEHDLYVFAPITTNSDNGYNKLFLGAGNDIKIYAPITLGGFDSLKMYAGHDIKIDAELNIGGYLNMKARHNILINTDSILSGWSQTYDGNVILEDSALLGSTYGDIKFKGMINNAFWTDPNDLALSVAGNKKVEFYGSIGQWDPLNSLTVLGGVTEFKRGAWEVVTLMDQFYENTVITWNRFMKFEAMDSGSISFLGLGVMGIGAYDPCGGFLIETGTADGYTGGGIFGSLDLRYLILGGSGGSDLTNTTVEGYTGLDTLSHVNIKDDATGLYCVNGNPAACIPVMPLVMPFVFSISDNEANLIVNSQIFTLPNLPAWALQAGGDVSVININGVPTDVYTSEVCGANGCSTISIVIGKTVAGF